ncbi:hypothetical protein [Aeromicrobium sp. CTD01-1L150]|uniref:hypothetical protein n=1 Tax=Aeromicrobium sp. CTD01-1L150 TaxID=3341830 RepID=UPI0035BF7407
MADFRELQTPTGIPALAQAASLALAVFEHARVTSWDELGEAVRSGVAQACLSSLVIEPDQAELMNQHAAVLRLIRHKPLVTVAVCPKCERWVLVAGSVPTSCKARWGCDGSPVKASKAKRPVIEKTKSASP